MKSEASSSSSGGRNYCGAYSGSNEKAGCYQLKFNWKNKKVIGGFFTVIFLALGIANPEIAAQAGTAVACAVVNCDAA